MKISALIPTYNRRTFVRRAIASILAQTVPVDEIIVVDDGSTDGTSEEIEREFGSQVRIVRQSNQGVSGARRRAILESRGAWVAFLDSDDEWTPDRNSILLRAIEKVPAEVAWIFGNSQRVTDQGDGSTLYEELGLTVPEAVHVFEDALSVQYPWQFGILPSSVIKREALLKLECFSENLRDSEDRLVGIKMACHYGFAAVPEVVTKFYRTSDLSATSLVYARDALLDLNQQADYHRAGMMAFSLAARHGGRQPWGELYADAVRGMCKVLSKQNQSFRRLSFQQFRYGVSCKSVAFFCAALLGTAGIDAWKRAASMARATLSPK
jgi:glycosyltransferase involved in cell wall biosynthesis